MYIIRKVDRSSNNMRNTSAKCNYNIDQTLEVSRLSIFLKDEYNFIKLNMFFVEDIMHL